MKSRKKILPQKLKKYKKIKKTLGEYAYNEASMIVDLIDIV